MGGFTPPQTPHGNQNHQNNQQNQQQQQMGAIQQMQNSLNQMQNPMGMAAQMQQFMNMQNQMNQFQRQLMMSQNQFNPFSQTQRQMPPNPAMQQPSFPMGNFPFMMPNQPPIPQQMPKGKRQMKMHSQKHMAPKQNKAGKSSTPYSPVQQSPAQQSPNVGMQHNQQMNQMQHQNTMNQMQQVSNQMQMGQPLQHQMSSSQLLQGMQSSMGQPMSNPMQQHMGGQPQQMPQMPQKQGPMQQQPQMGQVMPNAPQQQQTSSQMQQGMPSQQQHQSVMQSQMGPQNMSQQQNQMLSHQQQTAPTQQQNQLASQMNAQQMSQMPAQQLQQQMQQTMNSQAIQQSIPQVPTLTVDQQNFTNALKMLKGEKATLFFRLFGCYNPKKEEKQHIEMFITQILPRIVQTGPQNVNHIRILIDRLRTVSQTFLQLHDPPIPPSFLRAKSRKPFYRSVLLQQGPFEVQLTGKERQGESIIIGSFLWLTEKYPQVSIIVDRKEIKPIPYGNDDDFYYLISESSNTPQKLTIQFTAPAASALTWFVVQFVEKKTLADATAEFFTCKGIAPIQGPCYVHTPNCKGCSFDLSIALQDYLTTGTIQCPKCRSQCLMPDLEIDQRPPPQVSPMAAPPPMPQTPVMASPQMQSSLITTPQMPTPKAMVSPTQQPQQQQQPQQAQQPPTPTLPDEDPQMRMIRLSFADALCSLLRPQTIEIDWADAIFKEENTEPPQNTPIEIPENIEEYIKYVCSLW